LLHGVCKLTVGPVEHRNAVVVDEMQQPVETMSKFSHEQLRHADNGGERWIYVLEHLLQNFIITGQRVFQFHLEETAGVYMNYSERSLYHSVSYYAETYFLILCAVIFLDPEGGSQNATLVVVLAVVGISSLKSLRLS